MEERKNICSLIKEKIISNDFGSLLLSFWKEISFREIEKLNFSWYSNMIYNFGSLLSSKIKKLVRSPPTIVLSITRFLLHLRHAIHGDLCVALSAQSSIYGDHCCKTGCATPPSYLQKVNKLYVRNSSIVT